MAKDLKSLHGEISHALHKRDFATARHLLKTAPPNDLNFIFMAGLIALMQGEYATAITHFSRARAQKPEWVEASLNLVHAHIGLKQYNEAISIAQMMVAGSSSAAPCLLLAHAADMAGKQNIVNDALSIAVGRGARDATTISNLWLGRRKMWDWSNPLPTFNETELTPAAATVLSTDAAFQRRVAEHWRSSSLPPSLPVPAAVKHEGRIRIGYLSSDLHHHATAYLIAELFALHDSDKFDVYCFSYGPDDGSTIRARIEDSAATFIDLSQFPPQTYAEQIRAAKLDILIDLKGHTRNHALPLLAARPAPIQIHYLGHPGTIGADFIDYLVTDETISPAGTDDLYSEKLIRLPHCYQINDNKRHVAEPLARSAYGLPDDKTILACFNQSYKLTPEIFAIWCDILQERPQTILWLYCNVDGAEENLRATFAAAGLENNRLIIAGALPNDQHIARYQAADIIIDTYPYTSHTTGSDALYAGVPLITLQGETYASRVASSLLHNVGLDELITTTPEDYKNLILALIDDKPRREALRQRLVSARNSAPLFDTVQWVKDWESALIKIYKKEST